jgi:protein-disulfide isomerase/uncharacterized membrane protein
VKGRLLAAILLMCVGAATSGVLWFHHHGELRARAFASRVCGESGTGPTACDTVNQSGYSTVGGIPLAVFGLLFYGSTLSLLLLGMFAAPPLAREAATIAFWLVAAALAIDVVLLGVQVFALRTYCRLCLATYAVNVISGILLMPYRAFRREAGQETSGSERRVLVGGWILATLSLVGALAAGELGFAGRTEATELRAILDDPSKVSRYYEDKAAAEFRVAPVQTFELTDAIRLGPPNAPITIVEFTDYLCPFCKQLAPYLEEYLTRANGRVAVYVKNQPLERDCNPTLSRTVHTGACRMALGAICAQRAGKFAAYYRTAFGSEIENPAVADVIKLGATVGIDPIVFERCLSSPDARAALASEIEEGRRSKVGGTPSLFINGKPVPAPSYLERFVDVESERSGLPPLSQPLTFGR